MEQHFVIDVETLSTKSDAAIIAIGAVPFQLGDDIQGPAFYKNVRASFGRMDYDTILWWMQQGSEGRARLIPDAVTESTALLQLTCYLNAWEGEKGRRYIWCYGAAFDAPILEAAYERHSMPTPWLCRNVRCLRTLRDLEKHIAGTDSTVLPETAHSAADDARAHALSALGHLRALKEGVK